VSSKTVSGVVGNGNLSGGNGQLKEWNEGVNRSELALISLLSKYSITSCIKYYTLSLLRDINMKEALRNSTHLVFVFFFVFPPNKVEKGQ
jgi:hypothetical protein